MNTLFGAVSLESHNPQQSRTVSGSGNACLEYGQRSLSQETAQGPLLHHMSPDQGDQPVQEPQERQLASSVSSRSPAPSQFSYDSLEQIPASVDPQPREAINVRGQRTSNICSRWFGIWALEIVSCAIACLCLAAIFGILYTHQGFPLPQWPLNITIHALTSVFTAIFKMALLVPVADGISQFKWVWFDQPRELADIERLDQASRGAWGSFLLLVSRVPKLDAIWLANLGAIITIAALAIDPFSQQILQSEPCLQNITGAVAAIPTSQNFGLGITLTESIIPSWFGSLQAAIYMGLLSPPPNSSAAMTADCPTANCIFPSDNGATFSTLAMCHSCVDISHTATPWFQGLGLAIPSGARVFFSNVFASTTGSNHFDHHLFSFEALMSRDPYNSTDSFAVACGIIPCLKTFGANVTNGVYQEKELSSIELVPSGLADYTLATNETLQNGTWQSCMPTTQNTTANNLRINTTTMGIAGYDDEIGEYRRSFSNINNHDTRLWYPDDCVWWFGHLPVQAMSSFLNGLFDQKMIDRSEDSSVLELTQEDPWISSMYRNGTANMDTVDAFMDGLVWSMTAAMRQTSHSEATPRAPRAVYGQTQVMQTCLTVRWVWLSLPASLLGLQLAFVVAIVVTSRSAEHWRGDWKDSSLALLYHGLDGSAKRFYEKVERDELHNKEGMFIVGRIMKVQLRQGKDNWRFHPVPQVLNEQKDSC